MSHTLDIHVVPCDDKQRERPSSTTVTGRASSRSPELWLPISLRILKSDSSVTFTDDSIPCLAEIGASRHFPELGSDATPGWKMFSKPMVPLDVEPLKSGAAILDFPTRHGGRLIPAKNSSPRSHQIRVDVRTRGPSLNRNHVRLPISTCDIAQRWNISSCPPLPVDCTQPCCASDTASGANGT